MAAAEPTGASIEALLGDPRWELMPFESFDGEIERIPAGQTVTITASPQKGVDPTVERAIDTVADGTHEIVPHLAARMVTDRDHLAEIATRLEEAGITDIFVPGGDIPEPKGAFSSAFELLAALDELGFAFEDVGITGYPEGHPAISEAELERALEQKRPYASYIVTQICYDPGAVVSWIEATREDGVDLPVHVGVPGVMNYQKLLGISRRVGVGDSIRFIRKTSGLVDMIRRVIGSRGVYYPDDLIEGLAPYADDPTYDIAGVHLYTFNRAGDTETWRRERLAGAPEH